ncbi:hypothetical protein [Pseudoroseomonas cervicalis]|uniref:hypothetical protein n=1 Tax=Teichococcus cervicalis TaxID=204525 RepID=UPI0022F1C711|nr:hypothetical protein [Pseudoroseomonas cervicalis]WBV43157.1 hypothetical protein PFY06_00895 [Pseudoroseomonas cervicalis]
MTPELHRLAGDLRHRPGLAASLRQALPPGTPPARIAEALQRLGYAVTARDLAPPAAPTGLARLQQGCFRRDGRGGWVWHPEPLPATPPGGAAPPG